MSTYACTVLFVVRATAYAVVASNVLMFSESIYIVLLILFTCLHVLVVEIRNKTKLRLI